MNQELTLKKKVNNFLFNWCQFPIDYWWRKKYKIPFGSSQHREMNFIDMFIEYQEEIEIQKSINKEEGWEDEVENEALDLNTKNEVVKISQEEIDEDFENLDLEQFDKKE